MIIQIQNNKLFIIFSWQPESKFPFSQVRLPPLAQQSKQEFTLNQEIEVYSRANENEASGWWKAIIKVLIYKLIVITFNQQPEHVQSPRTHEISKIKQNIAQ